MGQLSCLGGHTGWGWGARELNYKRDRGTGDQAPLRGEGSDGPAGCACVHVCVHVCACPQGQWGKGGLPGKPWDPPWVIRNQEKSPGRQKQYSLITTPPPGLHTFSTGWVCFHHLLVSPLDWFPSHLSEMRLVFILPARAGCFKTTCHFHPLCQAQCLAQGSDSEK